MTTPELPVRRPGSGLPGMVRGTAVLAGRRRVLADPLVLARVRDALLRLPDSARGRHYFEIPGDCLACPRELREAR